MNGPTVAGFQQTLGRLPSVGTLGGVMVKIVRWWWRHADHYDWFSAYLQARGMAGQTRAIVALISVVLAMIQAAMLWNSLPGDGVGGVVLAAVPIGGGIACALLWLARWPSRPDSIAFVSAASASIAMAVLAQPQPVIAMLACAAFVTTSGYIAIFHGSRLLVANTVVVVLVPIVPAMALAAAEGAVRASCQYALVLIVNVVVPFGIQLLVHSLGIDLHEADRDPLTGLLNRRAFFLRAGHLVAAHGRSDAHLVVAMIDLDRFKSLNDSEGHAAGDRALSAVGRALRDSVRASAVVGRVGGEEFLVADVFSVPERGALGRRLCAAVAALPHGVTASVGSAAARCDHIAGHHDPNLMIASLVAAADDVMYAAKREGGNQSRVRGPLDEYSL